MPQSLILKSHAEPSFFNKEALIGFLIVPPLGGIIGALIGKNRMETEKQHGKAVNATPSFWNKDTLLGGLIGLELAGFVAIATGAFATVASASLPVGLIAGVVGMIAAPIIGAYIGGKHGEKVQAAEFEQAKQQAIVQQVSQNVSPEVGQAVEYRLAHDKQWGKQMLEEKLLAAGQEQVR